MLLEDLFVIDAPTLWRQRARGGELVALHPLDGATIKRVIDDWGRTPQPFFDNGALVHPVAYQQILKGYPAVDYAARDIIYAPRNPRANRVYGFSPVEQIVMTANIALKRQMFTLSHFTEGNIPECLIGVPDSWTPDQIKNFQDYWDAYFTGDLAARRRAKFVPGGVAKTFIQTKEPELKGVFDEWLARIVCYAFSVSHQAFVNQTNRSTGETQKEMAEEEGLWPVLKWVKRLIDGVLIEDFGEEDIEFAWGEDAQIDAGQQAQVLTSYVGAGNPDPQRSAGEAGRGAGRGPGGECADGDRPGADAGGAGLGGACKNYNADRPRDWRGRFGSGDGATRRRVRKPCGWRAMMLAPRCFWARPRAAAGVATAGEAVRQWLNSSNHSSKPGDKTPTPPARAEQPATAASPAIPPNDQGDNKEEPKKKFTVPDREPSIDNPEDYKLGWDSDTKKFRPNEVKTAWRIQEALQQTLERISGGGSWVAPDGKVYDAAGPARKEFFNIDEFSASIDRHLLKSGITPVIDVTGMPTEQVEQINNYITSLPPEERAKLLKIRILNMAVMALQNGAIWGSSASLLEFVAGKLKESGYFSRFEKNFDAIEAGWQHLDFSDLNEDEQSKFRMVVRSVINEVKSAPADCLENPGIPPVL